LVVGTNGLCEEARRAHEAIPKRNKPFFIEIASPLRGSQ
jgi:hypothetical protein